MEKASKVFYSIANFFTWILAIFFIAGIVFSSLKIANVFVIEGISENAYYGIGSLITCIFMLIVCLITIAMVRRAKADGSSKGWDVFFIIVGILQTNIFYILGGLFGLIAPRK